MPELGETTDPTQLVPGVPDALRTTARLLGEYGDLLAQVGSGLRGIDDGGWTGQAGNAFREAFDSEPTRWLTCGDCFLDAKVAVSTYAETLSWAQQQAATAIALWEDGERATATALAAHQQAQRQVVQQAAVVGQPPPDEPSFDDPGAPLREQARETLGRARDQVSSGGADAADEVDRAQEPAPEKRYYLLEAAEAVGEAIGDAAEAVGEAATYGADAVADGVDVALDGVGVAADATLDGVGSAVDGTLDVAGDIVGGVLGGVTFVTGIDPLDDAGEAVDSALDDAGDTAGGALGDAGDTTATALDDAGDAVANAIVDDEADHPNRQTGTLWDRAEGRSEELPDPTGIYTTPERRDHILAGNPNDETDGGHRSGTHRPFKSEFPPGWADDVVIDHAMDIAENPDTPPRQLPNTNWEVHGVRDNVEVRVIVTPTGGIDTAIPIAGEGVVVNDSRGVPRPRPR